MSMDHELLLKLKSLLIKHEGLKLKLYQDIVGKWTIGVGRNLEDNGIRESEAIYMLNNDIEYFYNSLDERFPWFKNLDDTRKIILLNMSFNLGIKGLLSFKKMLQSLSIHSYLEASIQMLESKWAYQVGKRAEELSEMMRTGCMPNEMG